jgi:hypothetical protein
MIVDRDRISMVPTTRARVPTRSLGVTRSDDDPRHRTRQRQRRRRLWERVLDPQLLKVVYSGEAHHARAHRAATLLGPLALAIPAPAPRALSAPSPPLLLLLRAVLRAIVVVVVIFLSRGLGSRSAISSARGRLRGRRG